MGKNNLCIYLIIYLFIFGQAPFKQGLTLSFDVENYCQCRKTKSPKQNMELQDFHSTGTLSNRNNFQENKV